MTETPKVFGWLADRTGCGTLRIIEPFLALDSVGIETTFDEKCVPEDLVVNTFVGQRVCKSEPTNLWQNLARSSKRPRMVFELDDDLWNVDPSNENAFSFYNQGIVKTTGQYMGDIIGNLARNIEVADAVTTTTEPLAELLSQYNSNVVIVPNYLPARVLEFEEKRRERLTIGWHGSASHRMDWQHGAGQQVSRFLQRNPAVDIHMVGVPALAMGLKIPKDQLVETAWVHSVEDLWRTIDYDIGLAPLRPHVFNQSKSSLKFLENAALGIPTIASDCGPYADAIRHGETGFLVKRDHEWSTYLRTLTEDQELREGMGRAAKAWARTQTIESHVGEWVEALR